MAFDYDFSDQLLVKIDALKTSNKLLLISLQKKVSEIKSRDNQTIDFYKNLKSPMQEYKRVHIGSFVLTFKVDKRLNHILFWDLVHHDKAY